MPPLATGLAAGGVRETIAQAKTLGGLGEGSRCGVARFRSHGRRASRMKSVKRKSLPMFIHTETTPNPATLKFVPGRTVLASGVRDYTSPEAAEESPLASRLFELEGVTGVFLGSDFISVTLGDGDWRLIKPAVLGIIMEHFQSGAPVIESEAATPQQEDEIYDPKDAETVAAIKELLETRVRPTVARDGGDIVFHAYKDGIVYLHMRGACSGCPSATATLRNGIENLLKHFIPEVQGVEAV